MNKEKILEGIKTCSRMRNIWYNGRVPSRDFGDSVANIERVLGDLLMTRCDCLRPSTVDECTCLDSGDSCSGHEVAGVKNENSDDSVTFWAIQKVGEDEFLSIDGDFIKEPLDKKAAAFYDVETALMACRFIINLELVGHGVGLKPRLIHVRPENDFTVI